MNDNYLGHAGEILDLLNKAGNLLMETPKEENSPSYPRRYVAALIADSASIVHEIALERLGYGQRVLVTNLLTAIDALERSGSSYDAVIGKLHGIVSIISAHGLAIDGYNLREPRRRESNARGCSPD